MVDLRCRVKSLLAWLLIIAPIWLQSDKRSFFELKEGQLRAPLVSEYRSWEMVARSVVHGEHNPLGAPFAGLHLVYQDPASLRLFRDKGSFPDGTMILMEVWPLERLETESGFTSFPTTQPHLLVQLKDRRIFSGEGWAYFRFEPGANMAAPSWRQAEEASRCMSCHVAGESQDQVFLKHFPQWGRN